MSFTTQTMTPRRQARRKNSHKALSKLNVQVNGLLQSRIRPQKVLLGYLAWGARFLAALNCLSLPLFFCNSAKNRGVRRCSPESFISRLLPASLLSQTKVWARGLEPLGLNVLEAKLSRRVHVHHAERQVYQPGLDSLSEAIQF